MEKIIEEKDIGGYIGRLLRENFGRGPGNVICTFSHPFITVYITNFLSPVEKSLLNNQQESYVHKTRDLLMQSIIKESSSYIEQNISEHVKEFYYDWDLKNQSGIFIIILSNLSEKGLLSDQLYKNKQGVHTEIIEASKESEKPPADIASFFLNKRQLLIRREGILVNIEKELIEQGYEEPLRLAKRKLEKRLLIQKIPQLNEYLHSCIEDVFVDWDFRKDKSYICLILRPPRT
ncbi:DUF2294 domain-containing protein [Bacillus massiliglaciei]|uniref:DUF2294 domain-containing protein n=1 Tax=Bacillus massiliglaciei TaxID=1816693 RepID=UPI000DA61319|nr:Na-translocating system protein MpsC family protein [Bacillus massiliglaciei]